MRVHGLWLLSEPEAAAIFAVKTQDSGVRVGDRLVVCDAGGGTVDLISYCVRGITPALSVEECCVGVGRFCGSTYIDRAFEGFVKERLGGVWEGLKGEVQQRVVKNFEEVKCAFEDREGKDMFYVSIPTVDTVVEAGVFGGEMEIKREEMRALFDPVVKQIVELVEQQVASAGGEVTVRPPPP